MKRYFLCCLQMLSMGFLFAQQTGDATNYDPKDFFLPAFNPPAANVFRSANGTPGPYVLAKQS